MFKTLFVLTTTVFFLSACTPTLRLTPGEIPAVNPPPAALKSEAESYVASYISESNYQPITSGRDYRRVKEMVKRLETAAGYAANTFPVHLVDAGEEVNAAAFNGASILVYRELLRRVKSDDELATVLGHEVGHIMAEHYKDQKEEKSRADAVNVGSSLLGTIANIATSAAGYGGAASLAGDVTETTTGVIGYGAFVGSFSRTQEYEADHLGLMIMAKAGYDPRVSADFWARSKEIFGSDSSSVTAFFSTHPASEDRQDAIAEAMPFALKYYEAAKARK